MIFIFIKQILSFKYLKLTFFDNKKKTLKIYKGGARLNL